MANELHLILNRRSEVLREIEHAKSVIVAGEKELAELDMAGAVIARLSGKSWPPADEADAGAAKEAESIGFDENIPIPKSLPEMIEFVMSNAYKRGIQIMEPKEIRQEIAEVLDPNVRSEAVSSICWRMWKRGQLEKVKGTSAYRLPDKEKASDLLS